MTTIVAFDDSGSPGVKIKAKTMDFKRKTYVGVIIKSDVVEKVTIKINSELNDLKQKYGMSEFHITEMINKRGDWEGQTEEVRLSTFDRICEILSEFEFPCICQTWADSYYKKNMISKASLKKLGKVSGFKLWEYESFAFIYALREVKHYALDNKLDQPIKVYCDEGLKKKGSLIKFDFLEDVVEKSSVKFESSSANIYIQIADIAAYCFNKMQMIAVKENKTDLDKKILISINKTKFNYINSYGHQGNLENIDAEFYDYIQWLNHKDKHDHVV